MKSVSPPHFAFIFASRVRAWGATVLGVISRLSGLHQLHERPVPVGPAGRSGTGRPGLHFRRSHYLLAGFPPSVLSHLNPILTLRAGAGLRAVRHGWAEGWSAMWDSLVLIGATSVQALPGRAAALRPIEVYTREARNSHQRRPRETRVAILEDDRLVELLVRSSRQRRIGRRHLPRPGRSGAARHPGGIRRHRPGEERLPARLRPPRAR